MKTPLAPLLALSLLLATTAPAADWPKRLGFGKQPATNPVPEMAIAEKMMSKASFAGSLLGQDTGHLDAYITDKTLDGLFLKIGEEEKRIRENPVARTTDLLQTVFGRVQP